MIAVETKAIHAPIQLYFFPASFVNAPIGPERAALPVANSVRIRGTDQRRRKTTHATRKEPPPLEAAMRGKRQMLPVPTAIPSMASIIAARELKTGFVMRRLSRLTFLPLPRAPGAAGANRPASR